MIQHVGGGRVIDHGPQRPHAGPRSIISGVALVDAVAMTRPLVSPEARQRAREAAHRRRQAALARFLERHGDCTCHVIYGGQPRRVR